MNQRLVAILDASTHHLIFKSFFIVDPLMAPIWHFSVPTTTKTDDQRTISSRCYEQKQQHRQQPVVTVIIVVALFLCLEGTMGRVS
jgi:predicted nucleic acid-binding Zn ribbon protein